MEVVLAKVALTMVFLHVCDVCGRTLPQGIPRLRDWALAWLRSVTSLSNKFRRSELKSSGGCTCDRHASAVLEQLHAIRVCNARRFAYATQFVLIGPMCLIIAKNFGLLPSRPRRWLTPHQDLLFTLCYFLSLVLGRVLRVANPHPRLLKFGYSLLMLSIIAFFGPGVTERETLFLAEGLSVSLRLVVGNAFLDARLAIFWNSVYLVTVSLTYWTTESHCDSMPTQNIFYWTQVATFLGITHCLHIFEESFRAQAQREAELAASRTGHSAVSSLLNIMCDAVLELDAGLCIVGGHPKLAGMLLLADSGSARRLEGAPLPQLLATDEERQLFERRMSSDAGAVPAELFHTKMLDGGGRVIDVEVFHVSFQGGSGQQHVVGVREHTDLPAEARAVHSGDGDASMFFTAPAAKEALTESAVLPAATLTGLLFGTAWADCADAARMEEEAIAHGNTMVAIAYNAITFEVIGCTEAWACAFRRWPLALGDSLYDWLQHPSNSQFLLDSTSLVNALMNEEPSEEDELFTKQWQLILKPKRASCHDEVEVKAVCTTTFSTQDEGDASLAVAFAVLTRPQIRSIRMTSGASSSRRSRASSNSQRTESSASARRGTARVATASGTIGHGTQSSSQNGVRQAAGSLAE